MSNLSFRVKRIADRLGIIIQRSNLYSNQNLRLQRFLQANRIDTVLDVGGNRGDYAESLIAHGYEGKIYSFEPLPEVHKILSERSKHYADRWIVAPRCAISDMQGSAQFNVTRIPSSSSMLKPDRKMDEFPEIFAVDEVIDVRTETIAGVCEMLGIESDGIFLKLDIQGGEKAALKGAAPLLPRIRGIVVEMSIQIIYEGQASAKDLDTWILSHGYELWDMLQVYRHPETGRLIQVDMTYFRSPDAL